MLNFRIIPVFLSNSSMHCDDIHGFAIRPSLKLIGTTFHTIKIKGKIPSDFQFDEFVIKSRSFIGALHAAEEAALTYWEMFKYRFQSTDKNGTAIVVIETGPNGDWYLIVTEKSTNLPLMRFYIDESR